MLGQKYIPCFSATYKETSGGDPCELSTKIRQVLANLAGMHADERCPILPPRVRRLHWPLDHPAQAKSSADEIRDAFRRCRDDIECLIREFFLKLAPLRTRPGHAGAESVGDTTGAGEYPGARGTLSCTAPVPSMPGPRKEEGAGSGIGASNRGYLMILLWRFGRKASSPLNNLQRLSKPLVKFGLTRDRPEVDAAVSLRHNGDPCVLSVNAFHPHCL